MITSLFAALLGVLFFSISFETIKARRSNKVLLGSGESDEIIHLVSAHSNFSSYTPIFLILFCLIEKQNISVVFLYLVGSIFFIGRILHFTAMKNKEIPLTKRVLGMRMTLMPLMVLSIVNLVYYIKSVF